jgi:hypothetical protein
VPRPINAPPPCFCRPTQINARPRDVFASVRVENGAFVVACNAPTDQKPDQAAFSTFRAASYFAANLGNLTTPEGIRALRESVEACDVIPVPKPNATHNGWTVTVAIPGGDCSRSFSSRACAIKFAHRCLDKNAMTKEAVETVARLFLDKCAARVTSKFANAHLEMTVNRPNFAPEKFSFTDSAAAENFRTTVEAHPISSDELASLMDSLVPQQQGRPDLASPPVPDLPPPPAPPRARARTTCVTDGPGAPA